MSSDRSLNLSRLFTETAGTFRNAAASLGTGVLADADGGTLAVRASVAAGTSTGGGGSDGSCEVLAEETGL